MIKSDICIIGGGVSGLSLAAALSTSKYLKNHKIVVVDPGKLEQTLVKNRFSNRVVSLNPASTSFLQGIDVWDRIPRKFAFSKMNIWQSKDPGLLSFDSNGPFIANIVENNLILNSLLEKLKESQVTLLSDSKVSEILRKKDSEWPILHTKSHQIETRLLIGADGLNSIVRNFARISNYGYDYNQKGIVAILKCDPQQVATAWQRFLPSGPVALLPQSDQGDMSLVWTMPSKKADKIMRLDGSDFVHLLNTALQNPPEDLEFVLSNISSDGTVSLDIKQETEWNRNSSIKPPLVLEASQVAGFPLRLRNSSQYIENRVALIGDAAHSVHPLAGLGLNCGLGDVQCLTSIIEKAVMNGQDYGRNYVLEEYARTRFPENLAVLTGVDLIQRMFAFNNPVWSSIRGFGLDAINSSGLLKNLLMSTASK